MKTLLMTSEKVKGSINCCKIQGFLSSKVELVGISARFKAGATSTSWQGGDATVWYIPGQV
jgi:hypothetical protein